MGNMLRWSGAGGLYPVTKVDHVHPSESDRRQLRLVGVLQSIKCSLELVMQTSILFSASPSPATASGIPPTG